jgi:guanidinoacetate N-methyltransferase
MFTVKTRITIGFPKRRIDWAKARAVFDKHALRIAGHPVMEDWENGYMRSLAKIASSNGGKVLEVGYGLGLSARAIQDNGIKNHYIIECHPDVVARSVKDLRENISKNTVHVLSGFWEDITPMLASKSFDGILFDTYPLSEEEIHGNHFWFFEEAHRLLKPGGVLTYYSDEAKGFSQKHLAKLKNAGFRNANINYKICKVNPPKNCEYWQDNTILAPIVKKS